MRQNNAKQSSSITCVNFHSQPLGSSFQAAGTGAMVKGFPNGGVATTVNDGHDFTWGDLPIIAAGKTYDLCWCNGTASACVYLGIDVWNCFLRIWNPRFFLGVEFADVLVMFAKQIWTKKGSREDIQIHRLLFVCLKLESFHFKFQLSTLNPSTLHVSQPVRKLRTEADFSVRLGPLHFGGPSADQAIAMEVCRAGLPCEINNFEGQAIEKLDAQNWWWEKGLEPSVPNSWLAWLKCMQSGAISH